MTTRHLLISAGRGPQECAWAVARLTQRLEADAARKGLTIERVETVKGDRPGTFLSILVKISGGKAEALLTAWSGTLCWQAPSPFRQGTSRKNWYVVAQPCDPDTTRTEFDEGEVDVVACRTGGPGGQRRNKVSTAARATHRPSGLVIVVDTERHFGQNRSRAIALIRHRLMRADDAAERAAVAARRHIHDELVRGDPTRTERP
ncbi:peptide chain release factor H [Asanoa siamensis]|uniref:Peptide chain release factor H n=1 Tax=Asanoa siamensis TaxID=926357 RepID=A0ABQ4CLC5_9ACTN|nr:peptide chain release factor H [Asanoa siamensis]GIF72086.1 peptide chain release factor H [Asanoa siamensis]